MSNEMQHKAQLMAREFVTSEKGYIRHHWSYARGNELDVVEVTPSEHRTIHGMIGKLRDDGYYDNKNKDGIASKEEQLKILSDIRQMNYVAGFKFVSEIVCLNEMKRHSQLLFEHRRERFMMEFSIFKGLTYEERVSVFLRNAYSLCQCQLYREYLATKKIKVKDNKHKSAGELLVERPSSFKKAYIEYSRIKKDINAGDISGNRLDRAELISMYNPLVEQAFRLLGDEKVESVSYRTTNVKRKIKALSSGGAEVVQRCISVIIDTLEPAFTGVIEVVMTRASLEGRIKSVFLSNGIDEKPKVKILERHLSIKQFRKRVVDNKGNKKDIPMVRLSKL